mmetsp:Transcript_29372/g.52587  ORF Transcript_29372/g.52587 Transcript_29372/m.52587 type:complete len:122 (-) Transcript_29372:1247-1612(-)
MADSQERKLVRQTFMRWCHEKFFLKPSQRSISKSLPKEDLRLMEDSFVYGVFYNFSIHTTAMISMYLLFINPNHMIPHAASVPLKLRWGVILLLPSLSAWASFRSELYQSRMVALAKGLTS